MSGPKASPGKFFMSPDPRHSAGAMTATIEARPGNQQGLEKTWFQTGQLVEVKGYCNYNINERFFYIIPSEITPIALE